MAKISRTDLIDNDKLDELTLQDELSRQFENDERGISALRDDPYLTWEEREATLLGRLRDQISGNTRSQVNTQELQNLVWDGASRVMAQIPTGKVVAMSLKDKGQSSLMNLILQKYVIPNANSQFGDLLMKYKVWDVYSRVYGAMPALVRYRVEDDYIGPDLDIVSPRMFFPEKGATSIQEASRVFIDSYVSKSFLKSTQKIKESKWKNVQTLLDLIDQQGASDKSDRESQLRTYTERSYNLEQSSKGNNVLLRTRYQKGRWVTFAPDYENTVVRDIPNPNNNSQIPVVMKQCFPLIDRMFGLAEFERGISLYRSMNSLVNLYFEGVKMSIFPPFLIDPTAVVPSSIKYEALAKWYTTGDKPINQIMQQLQTSPQGINTFSSTYSFLKAALLNLGATTDTSVSSDIDPGLGKTPAALQLQGAREGARDNWDRFMMEKAIEQSTNLMVDMIANKQDKSINISLFGKEIEDIQTQYPDIKDLVKTSNNGDYAEVEVKKKDIDNTKYKFFIDAGSTMKKDEAIENQTLTEQFTMIVKELPGAADQIMKTGSVIIGKYTYHADESIKRQVITSGVQDWDKIISDTTKEDIDKLNPPQPEQPPIPQQPMMPMQGMQQVPSQMPQMQQQLPPQGIPQGVPTPQGIQQDPAVDQMMAELNQIGGGQ